MSTPAERTGGPATDLVTILADMASDADALERTGNLKQADYLRAAVARIRTAAEDYMTWLSEPDAILKSALSERTLRRRFRDMLDCGTARYGSKRQREYLSMCVPNRPDVQQQRARGRAA